jgi:uncharacterized tellurite resistance protein B-like protein
MPVLLGLLAIVGGILYWVIRAHSTVRAVQDINRDTKGLQSRIKYGLQRVIGTPLQRVRDPRLAAVILMIQLVRTGSPVTEAEETTIVELMKHPLGIEDPPSMFGRAWEYTEARRPFSTAADALLPLLRKRLSDDERLDLIDILRQVASAYSEPSELQDEAIVRLKRRLLNPKGLRLVS